MQGLLGRLLLLLRHRGGGEGSVALGGFLDGLVQTFENCRPGLSDEMVARGRGEVERFFLELYEKELPRLEQAVEHQAPYLEGAKREKFLAEADALVRRVVLPGYLRLALAYTPRERNNFYLARAGGHGFERVAWVLGGMLLGALAVAVPFIPIWAKEWILVFGLGGFFVPTLRRFLSVRAYEAELNELVRRADRELGRIDLAYLTSGRLTAARVGTALSSGEPVRGQDEAAQDGNRRGLPPTSVKGG